MEVVKVLAEYNALDLEKARLCEVCVAYLPPSHVGKELQMQHEPVQNADCLVESYVQEEQDQGNRSTHCHLHAL